MNFFFSLHDRTTEINAKFDECNAEVEEYNEECMRKTGELNSALPEEEHYYCVQFLPRSLPEPLFYTVHRMYFMHDTNPSKIFFLFHGYLNYFCSEFNYNNCSFNCSSIFPFCKNQHPIFSLHTSSVPKKNLISY